MSECPPVNQPRLFEGSFTAAYLSTPGFDSGKYPPNMNCHFAIIASSPRYRIQLTVYSSKFEEPIFGDCDDYIVVRESKKKELLNSTFLDCLQQTFLEYTVDSTLYSMPKLHYISWITRINIWHTVGLLFVMFNRSKSAKTSETEYK